MARIIKGAGAVNLGTEKSGRIHILIEDLPEISSFGRKPEPKPAPCTKDFKY